jgi:hypothetical protein
LVRVTATGIARKIADGVDVLQGRTSRDRQYRRNKTDLRQSRRQCYEAIGGGVRSVVAETAQLDHNVGGFGDLNAFGNTAFFGPTGCWSAMASTLSRRPIGRCAPVRIDCEFER